MPPPKGHPKWGGRVAGTPNKPKPKPGVGYVRELLEQMGVNSVEKAVVMAYESDDCRHCAGKKTITVRKLESRIVRKKKKREVVEHEITCPSCEGAGYERVPVNTRARILLTLTRFQQPLIAPAPIEAPKDDHQQGDTLEELLNTFSRETHAPE